MPGNLELAGCDETFSSRILVAVPRRRTPSPCAANCSRRGWRMPPNLPRADVVVLNTCTVTAAADSQAREAVRKIHRANPAARIIVTGCYAQRAPEELASLAGVAYVVGNARQSEDSGADRARSGIGEPASGRRPSDFVPAQQSWKTRLGMGPVARARPSEGAHRRYFCADHGSAGSRSSDGGRAAPARS